MPVEESGQLRPFTEGEIEAMSIRTFGVRDMSHGQETREIGQSTLEKSFVVNWESRFDFCELVCGDEKLWNDSGTTKLSRLLPDNLYGRHPDRDEIVATKITRIRGHGGPGVDDEDGVVEYPDAVVEVFYEHVPYDLKNDEETVSEFERYTYFGEAQGAVESISIPGGSMRFWRGPDEGTDPPHGLPVPYGVSVSRATEEFVYNFVRLPYEAFEPTSALYERIYGNTEGELPFLGCVNSEVIFNRAVGTVVFTGVTPILQRAHTGRGRRWSLQYKFAYSSFGWNWLYFNDPTGTNSGWYIVNNKEYQTAGILEDGRSLTPGARDLNDLFKVGA